MGSEQVCSGGESMSIENLVAALMIAYFICTHFIAYKFTMLICHAGNGRYYEFKAMWYHKAAGTYALAFPIFTLIVWLMTEFA